MVRREEPGYVGRRTQRMVGGVRKRGRPKRRRKGCVKDMEVAGDGYSAPATPHCAIKARKKIYACVCVSLLSLLAFYHYHQKH